MWFILILIYICIYLLHIETKRLVFHRQFKHIPSNREYPIIGSPFTIRCSKTNEFVKVSDLLCPAPISKFTAFGELVFAISDPGITQKVLLSPVFHKRSDTIRFFEMENALFTSKYENWKPLRKPLNPTFAKRAVLSMQPRINEHIDRLVAQIGMKVGTGTFEVFPLVAKFDIEEVFDTILDAKFTCDQSLINTLNEATNNIGHRFFNPLYHADFVFKFTPMYRKAKNAHNVAQKVLIDSFGDDFQQHVKKRILTDANNNELKDGRFFIDELCKIKKNGHNLTYEEIAENIKTIIIAGYETQSHTISFTLLLLAMHPEIGERVYEEIRENYKTDSYVCHETVKKMTYLDMVIKEVLRLFPVAPITIRESLAPTYIDKIGAVPQGATFLIIMYKLHRLESVWGTDANKFIPENFTPENVSKRPPFSYIPFGGGGRICIGMQYANLNLRMTLIKILSKYKFTTKLKFDDINVRYGIALKLDGQYLVEAHLR